MPSIRAQMTTPHQILHHQVYSEMVILIGSSANAVPDNRVIMQSEHNPQNYFQCTFFVFSVNKLVQPMFNNFQVK